jgi:23S rRNA G2069 N7-methylase RlmK/C1962 C5-methylase RlmI
MTRVAADVLDVHPSRVFVKFRDRQRGKSQYERRGDATSTFVVSEGELKFKVNLSDYIDTGLFLDHRQTRQMVRDESLGKRFLNLFAYTGSFSVYAAAGGAISTTTVDLSRTYLDWAIENFRLNSLPTDQQRFIQRDAKEFLDGLADYDLFDLAVVDPPTFSNSKGLEQDWDVQNDHLPLLSRLVEHISPGGVIYFSNNFRRFKLAEDELVSLKEGLVIREISQKTVPEDFRNRRIHRCWRIQVPG